MHRNKKSYEIGSADAGSIKAGMLNWSKQFSILVFLDSNSYRSVYDGYECLLAAGCRYLVPSSGADPLTTLQAAHNEQRDWMFGHICYDLKNVLEPALESRHPARHHFPLLQFFVPESVCYIDRNCSTFTIETYGDPDEIKKAIDEASSMSLPPLDLSLSFTPYIQKDKYIDIVGRLREHIREGDCYEINFCGGGHATAKLEEPLAVFAALNRLSPAPFAAYYRDGDRYLMCASPERYLRKSGRQVLSQPIKGTARRGMDTAADAAMKTALRGDIKERAENVMIVDLVRNDLARCCEVGSVTVDELFGIYTFPQVHQMISTVSGTLRPDMSFADAIRTSFPMGSMTGAPKFKVMQLIDRYEEARRELFSGTIGYITPAGDMDLNVIIRSLYYNAGTEYLSYSTGGAITWDSIPEKEWEEMRLKAWAVERLFQPA
ncbi:MAG: anthranilate synthase component I family protein [Flavipsychrobacter sp.]|nr:anthranilate synthase component I family protein [Flavipsychrobacter sp.]